MQAVSERRVLDVTDKMKLIQWLYPDVYAKLKEQESEDK